jgi:hypothetical protein
MKRAGIIIILASIAVFVFSCMSFAAGEPSVLRITKHNIPDPQMNNATAATVAVPDGWKVAREQIAWNYNLYSHPANVFFVIEGPNDGTSFSFFNGMRYCFDQRFLELLGPAVYLRGDFVGAGMIHKQPVSAADYYQSMILQSNKNISNLQIKNITKPQEVTNMLDKEIAALNGQMAAGFVQYQASSGITFKGVTYDLAELEYTYAEGGKRYEEIACLVTVYKIFASIQQASYGKEYIDWTVGPLVAKRAFEGKLKTHDAEFALMMGNSAIDPIWNAAVEKIIEKGSIQGLQEAIANQKTLQEQANIQSQMLKDMRDTYDYTRRNQQEIAANQQQSLSNTSRGWTNVFTETDTWQGGDGTYSAPSGYDNAWQGPGGQMAVTNDSNFNPNYSSDYSGDWSQMEKTPW